MPTLLTKPPEAQPPQIPPRKRWTREECAELETAGLFKNERVELIAGELISKMGKNRPHANAFRLMLVWLQKTLILLGQGTLNRHHEVQLVTRCPAS